MTVASYLGSAVLAATSPAASSAPDKLNGWSGGGGSPLADFGQMALGLLIVVALIFVLAWVIRYVRDIGPAGGQPLRVVGQLGLGRKERVVLIEAGDKQLLLGVAPGRVETLHVLDEPIELRPGPRVPNNFGEILNKLRRRGQES